MGIQDVSLLTLGAGWTSTFLTPLLEREGLSHAETSTTGRDKTIKFVFDPASKDEDPYKALPPASTVLITFPLKGHGQSQLLTSLYARTHPSASPRWIQLGSTGIWQNVPGQTTWVTRESKYQTENERAMAEDELLRLGGCVLNLSGLWGGSRQPRTWLSRVAPSKEALKCKKSLHMIHGKDVARGVLGIHKSYTPGERWMLTDMFVYDWWALALGWGGESAEGEDSGAGEAVDWVRELMVEEGVRALPRSTEELGRAYDSREFWEKIGVSPVRARI